LPGLDFETSPDFIELAEQNHNRVSFINCVEDPAVFVFFQNLLLCSSANNVCQLLVVKLLTIEIALEQSVAGMAMVITIYQRQQVTRSKERRPFFPLRMFRRAHNASNTH